jgi:hypothetical protein
MIPAILTLRSNQLVFGWVVEYNAIHYTRFHIPAPSTTHPDDCGELSPARRARPLDYDYDYAQVWRPAAYGLHSE